MILIALGANLPAAGYTSPRATLEAALSRLQDKGPKITAKSRWYRSAPVPPSDQPDFVNGAACVETELGSREMLEALHAIEAEFGRTRSVPNAARTLDLDLLAYDAEVVDQPGGLQIPHPRLQDRSFVLLPLRDIAAEWRHPISGLSVGEMLSRLPTLEGVSPLDDD
ncbi:2-amino-4-hydroxy-6-hydroxymethyldihydropteridine diphosphokinase [Limibacillus sp. MBR-115]|jgi:2-amino-4-hydroxy-6-hydroxymethyldihydropteridine diphosphokinase|uniref:2-amino-4-hydroxy-6- hydroxymethyldihydropteridine diphosphokinase n=1 Tax=Limibacillus sp. MBR-115 TaxID=3156465 RepID=UPI00339159E7